MSKVKKEKTISETKVIEAVMKKLSSGLIFLGTILTLVSIGRIPCTSSTTCAGVKYQIAYVTHPYLLKLGLFMIVLGFGIRFFALSD